MLPWSAMCDRHGKVGNGGLACAMHLLLRTWCEGAGSATGVMKLIVRRASFSSLVLPVHCAPCILRELWRGLVLGCLASMRCVALRKAGWRPVGYTPSTATSC